MTHVRRSRPRVGGLVLVGGVLGLALATVMCAAPTEIVVDVYTEVACASGPKTTFKAAASLAELRSQAVTSELVACAPRTERSGRIVLSPSAARDETVAFEVATRNDAEDTARKCTDQSYVGCIVARRQLRFSPGASTRVEVALRLSCLDKACLPTETCRNGTCESAVLPESCLGVDCTDPAVEAPPPGPGDAAVATEAGADAAPPAEDVVPEGIGEVAPSPVYVLPGGEIRGLSVFDGGLVWLEVPPSSTGARVRKGFWGNLGAASGYLVGNGYGVSSDPQGNGIVAAQDVGQGPCAHQQTTGRASPRARWRSRAAR